jgi:hypothetical protein
MVRRLRAAETLGRLVGVRRSQSLDVKNHRMALGIEQAYRTSQTNEVSVKN